MTNHHRPSTNSAADVHNTLNYALGNLGGRQKSWIVCAPVAHLGTAATLDANSQPPAQPRRRGRPPKHALQRPLDAASSHLPVLPSNTSYTPHAERRPSLNSISPQLANVVSHKQGGLLGQSYSTFFPSPCPTEDPAANLSTPPNHEPSSDSLSMTQSTDSRQADSHEVIGTENQAKRGHRAPPQPQQQMPGETNAAAGPITASQEPPRTSSAQYGISRPRAQPLAAHPRTPRHQPPEQISAYARPDAQPAGGIGTWYTPQDCWEALHRFEAAYPASSTHAWDSRRLIVLRDAIQQQDWSYLTLHQYSSLLTLNDKAVPTALGTQLRLPQATKLIQHVLGMNADMSSVCLSFFATFPAPLETLAKQWPAMVEQQDIQFLLFISHAPDINIVRVECAERRFPLLAQEMIVKYQITSPTFQRLLFMSCLRGICRALPQNPYNPQYEAQAVAIFELNRAAFDQHALASQQHPQLEPFEELMTFGEPLRKLLSDYEDTLRHHFFPSASQYAGSGQLHLPYQQSQQPQAHPNSGLATTTTTTLPSNDRSGRSQPGQGNMPHMQTHERLPRRPVYYSNASVPSVPRRPRLQHNASAQQRPSRPQPQPGSRIPLLPPPGWTQPYQRVPNPARFGLHQAHLRSPTPKAESPSPLFYFIQGFIQRPVRLSEATRAIETLSFTLTAAEISRMASQVTNEIGYCTRSVTEASKTLRLRCIKWTGSELPSEHDWAISATAWIPYSHFRFNDTGLEQRRKVHYGKDQPIDLTHLACEGINTLEVAVMTSSTDTTYTNYLVAIEILGIQSLNSIKEQCLSSRRIPASSVLASIRQKLSVTSVNEEDDDDMAIVDSSLSISLLDPFSASCICAIPVRATSCAHIECFDLETFLNTRPRNGDISRADAWRCPICCADARPSQLIADGFLEDVQRELKHKGFGQDKDDYCKGRWELETENGG
ncbi:hypothetical protein J1614_003889 [Plenodomus biglobosus]|nr:hypothetical protein J1614_003889 [Plenodomus biglobosus]